MYIYCVCPSVCVCVFLCAHMCLFMSVCVFRKIRNYCLFWGIFPFLVFKTHGPTKLSALYRNQCRTHQKIKRNNECFLIFRNRPIPSSPLSRHFLPMSEAVSQPSQRGGGTFFGQIPRTQEKLLPGFLETFFDICEHFHQEFWGFVFCFVFFLTTCFRPRVGEVLQII